MAAKVGVAVVLLQQKKLIVSGGVYFDHAAPKKTKHYYKMRVDLPAGRFTRG